MKNVIKNKKLLGAGDSRNLYFLATPPANLMHLLSGPIVFENNEEIQK